MLNLLLNLWKMLEAILFRPTKTCKNCFKEIKDESLNKIINPNQSFCDECFAKLKPKFHKFKIGKIDAVSIYDYDENLKGLIYQFKGCHDYELKDVFLERFKSEINMLFKGYTIICAPSYIEDDIRRGFNHVEEAFKIIDLNQENLIYKKEKIKQSDRTAKERANINDFLALKEQKNLSKNKVLLVDDIYTTGSTMKACIELVKSLKPKIIKVLVLCKTKDR